MKHTIEISDEEIETAVSGILESRIAESIFEKRYSYDRGNYSRTLKTALNALLKERADEIVERCIPLAAEYIGKKGVKKFVDELGKKVETDV